MADPCGHYLRAFYNFYYRRHERTGPVKFVPARYALMALLAIAANSIPLCARSVGAIKTFHATAHAVSLPLGELARVTTPTVSGPARSLSASPQLATSTGVEGLNFDGLSYNGYGSAPPDANGAVGNTQFVQWVNVAIAVFDKGTGNLIAGPIAVNTLWQPLGGPCSTTNYGDGTVLFDKLASRWVLSRHANDANGWVQCVAVSTGSDATGTYNLYSFPLQTSLFPDYPKLGVWPDAYYLTINLLNPKSYYSLAGVMVCAFDRLSMLSNSNAGEVCFQMSSSNGGSLLPADVDGTTPPPSGSPNYLLNLGSNLLRLWSFHVDFAVPSNSTLDGPVIIPVYSFVQACGGLVCIPQLGTITQLYSVADRLMYRLAYRNFGGFESLVVTHAINSPARIRWYEIRNPGQTPVIYQQGTYGGYWDSNYRWMSSAAMDKMGDIFIGYSTSGSSMYPGIRFTGRLVSDPLATLEPETVVVQGGGSQTPNQHWGDYTSTSVDPVDDCTFWYTNEYLKSNGASWSTRITSFKFSSCQ